MNLIFLRIPLLAIITLFIALTGFGQSGTYFMTQYNPAEYNFDNSNYQVRQDDRGVVHIANRQGILHYDGNDWWLTQVPYSVYCLAVTEEKIYVGGREGFGYINASGVENQYISIDSVRRDIQKIEFSKNRGYFITETSLFSFDQSNPETTTQIETNGLELLDLIDVDDRIYLSTTDGLYELNPDNTIEPISFGPEGAYFIRKSASGKILYVTDSSHFYTQYEGKVAKLNFQNQSYLEDHTTTEVIWVSDELIGISTLSGGLLFVDAVSGETIQIIDYDSGLPDNQIYSIYLDNSGSVWASHEYGFTVISPNIPLRNFDHYPGLNGTIESVLPFNEELYVGTSLGVYRLTAKKKMSQRTVYDKVRIRVESAEEEVIEKKQRRGLFRRKAKAAEPKVSSPKYKYVYRERIIEEELSRSYVFNRVGGINAKSIQLMEFRGRLLAGTLHGLYEIKKDTAIQIIEAPVLSMFGLANKNLAFVSTVDEEVNVMAIYRGEWEETGMLDGLNDYIEQTTLDPEGNVWLCGADSLYRLVLDGRELVDAEVYHIENPHFDKIYSVNYQEDILFINSSGYFTYKDLKIVRNDDIQKEIGLPRKFLLSENGELLINTGSSWYGASDNVRTSLNFLSFFKDPKAVARDSDKSYYWVSTASNDLYKINIMEAEKLSGREELYLKEVRSDAGRIPIVPQMSVGHEANQLTFEFASPDYSGIYRKAYRFRLTNAGGTQSPWSNWSESNNVISYQFLPPGAYTLEASYRNALGKVINAEPFRFKIIAPYWQRPWFYVLEVLFFSGMLIFSFYLNRGRGRYGFVSRLLGFMTLILIVEFFQTIAEYYYETDNSPVINFFIQAFIALLILPVEGVLRKYLTRTPETSEVKKKAG